MRKPDGKHINLALQGGGAHGAFTWGVLDALLEDGRLSYEGITGTSAGSMNAVVM
ncbi:patatin-like phospholipase family protein, partial [Klebsiella pneumoniae]|nr:patatin-like phospholipase family protein [Klebsiella pneumoniae]